MGLVEALVLGVVQGFTEFLPISSDGHLVLVPALLGWKRFGLTFDVVLHAGTLVATVVYFRRDIARLLASIPKRAERPGERRMVGMLVLGTAVSGVVALLAEEAVESVETLPVVAQTALSGGFLVLTAALLAGAEFLAKRRAGTLALPAEEAVTWRKAVGVGLAQGTAVAPGLSRSGTTIASGLALGLTREEAARFSFLLSIPIVALATLKKLADVALGRGAVPSPEALAVGFLASAAVGYLAVAWLLSYVRKHSLYPFAIYTAVVGTAVLLWSLT